jgi:hypothetical protein
MNGVFDNEESWEHVFFVNAVLFPFLFLAIPTMYRETL